METPTRMMCAICNKVHKFDFEVPNEMWEECIIERFRKSPVCLECFTTRADERLLKWDDVIKITIPCSLATQIEIQKSVGFLAANSNFDLKHSF